MYKLNFLSKENDLNKIIKNQRKNRNNISFLFVSLWDEHCTALVDSLTEKYHVEGNGGEDLYIVDSFNMPHSFVVYDTTKLPHLVQVKRDGYRSEDYLPRVMRKLKV